MAIKVTQSDIQDAYQGKDIADHYVEKRFAGELNRLLHERQVAAIQRALDTAEPARVLEIAPGPGRITRHLHTPAQRVCLEYNQGMIDVGQAACDRAIQWIRGDAFELPTDGPFARPFDFAYTFRFVRHFKLDDRHRLYEQLRRVLRADGLLMFDAVNAVVSRPLRQAHPDQFPIYDKQYDSVEDLRRELRDASFELIGAAPVQRAYKAQWRSQVLIGPRSPWLNRLVIHTLERMSRRPALEWIVTCRRA